MLIVARRTNHKKVVFKDIEIITLEIGRSRVRFGLQAPKDAVIQTKLQNLREP